MNSLTPTSWKSLCFQHSLLVRVIIIWIKCTLFLNPRWQIQMSTISVELKQFFFVFSLVPFEHLKPQNTISFGILRYEIRSLANHFWLDWLWRRIFGATNQSDYFNYVHFMHSIFFFFIHIYIHSFVGNMLVRSVRLKLDFWFPWQFIFHANQAHTRRRYHSE